jgi:hypothetical protein
VNNTSPSQGADVLITEPLSTHIYIPLSRYVYQYLCPTDNILVHKADNNSYTDYDTEEIQGQCVASTDHTMREYYGDTCRFMDRRVFAARSKGSSDDTPGIISGGAKSSDSNALTSVSAQFHIPPQCALLLRVTGIVAIMS